MAPICLNPGPCQNALSLGWLAYLNGLSKAKITGQRVVPTQPPAAPIA